MHSGAVGAARGGAAVRSALRCAAAALLCLFKACCNGLCLQRRVVERLCRSPLVSSLQTAIPLPRNVSVPKGN